MMSTGVNILQRGGPPGGGAAAAGAAGGRGDRLGPGGRPAGLVYGRVREGPEPFVSWLVYERVL